VLQVSPLWLRGSFTAFGSIRRFVAHDVAVDDGWNLGRRPGLDGLRGIAILLVLACHWLSGTIGDNRSHALGAAGVTVFFVLSGFLITAQLTEERAASGRVSLLRFFTRRARRLLPALLVVVVFLNAIQLLSEGRTIPTLPTLLYFANWSLAAGHNLGALTPTWSLSIEEQFYLAWPLALIGSARWRRGPIYVAAAGIICSTALKLALMNGPDGGNRVYYGSDTEMGSLLFGVLLALVAHRGLREVRVPAWLLEVSTFALFGLAFVPSPVVGNVWIPMLLPPVAAVLIWTACSQTSGVLTGRVLGYVGRRSYALYLWNFPLVWIMWNIAGRSLGVGLVGIALAFGFAEVSWRMVEAPILGKRHSVQASYPEPGMATAEAVSPVRG
jgi:peptidoglycan/LPS O-acetylase OafA/YrhL